jgi:hypothetical protein
LAIGFFPVSLRRPFEPEGERQAILWLKVDNVTEDSKECRGNT